ncbi:MULTISPECIES: ABC transporter ATP-binding protein/permease [unclassified Undibacterium]|uniref:ABCB family ABC transporter ATP-binding protein/permease n=1 Tax=unclassified Undibacterium TaxID=2630295 RepID=UPI002AC939CC|nr:MULTISPECIES: ABC transporter ATP-binding protein/permease [unclassified Undibacterium]MEB0138274.1 ABC transporter ATP-binding protein/permease [Undibacterium sp. CCC2.1]MEB0171565.1 ABC transporter ATP-binding protein/permease [Undibacterium sp. CCC1.1]MEB0175515.1 ABC transporter ATP-binding protein/permease [Undibacterium sp. CCC3.4]MEB0214765.1 ABC transporter ATP-binding protein/permease [Undibacterium sp. 5I2]WPX45252.1 ABC transporter ATP-binding protein/permease [Undibacterium sp. 
MRRRENTGNRSLPAADQPRGDWSTIKTLLPYLWAYKWRVLLALSFLVAAKLANVSVPLLLKKLVDNMTISPSHPAAQLVLPVGLLLAYGALRLSTTMFTELREFVFAKVTQRAVRTIALQVFRHLHALSLRFHLNRQTGGVTRDIERGTRAVSSLVSYALFSIVPTLLEITMVLIYLSTHYDKWFGIITFCALFLYIAFTITVTEWRTHFRRTMNELDSKAHTKAIDSLLNYETVKYFGNEEYEAQRYDQGLQNFEAAAVKSQTSLSLLNTGQSLIIATAVTLILWRATAGVIDGSMSLGDLVLVNSFMLQLYVPLNFLGVLYREIKQSMADMEKLFSLLEQNQDIADSETALPLRIKHDASISFEHVNFSYESNRQILFDINFTIAAGTTTAVVGHSGSGKSTLSRLLFRFYDIESGVIAIAGQDVRALTQASVRAAIGIVPQDTVLFNDTIEYNIGYGKPGASKAEIIAVAKAAYIHDFIESLPDGYQAMVGERGLKLSGGEKQRVAIARTLLKNPPILIFDEATSALDSQSEQMIQAQLKEISRSHTSLVIAHRLSTIVDAQQILVMDQGRIIERGTHALLLAQQGAYARMWERQQSGASEVAVAALAEI